MSKNCFSFISPNHTIFIQKICNDIAIDVDFNNSIPKGTTVQRPSDPIEGSLYYNYTLHNFEFWNGSAWTPFGGSTPSVGIFSSQFSSQFN